MTDIYNIENQLKGEQILNIIAYYIWNVLDINQKHKFNIDLRYWIYNFITQFTEPTIKYDIFLLFNEQKIYTQVFVDSIIYFAYYANIIKCIKYKLKHIKLPINIVVKYYNNNINKIISWLSKKECDDFNIINARNIISNMCYYNKMCQLKIKSENYGFPKIKINYDGLQIDNTLPIKFKLSSINNNINGTFAFNSIYELFTMLRVSIEQATINNINIKLPLYINKGGYVYIPETEEIITLNLSVTHNYNKYIINSTDNIILHYLSNIKHLSYELILELFNSSNNIITRSKFGIYKEFHDLVYEKIHQLVDASYNLHSNKYVYIQCYRPECNHKNIFIKKNIYAKCYKCNIGEFCIKCRSSSHTGECNNIDNASIDFIDNTCIKCPLCNVNVYKFDGCNHMRCSLCSQQFCYLCGTSYNTPNEVINHHLGDVTENVCSGIINRSNSL
jgi:hypothetical protein